MKGDSIVGRQLRDRPVLFGYLAFMVTAGVFLSAISVARAFGWIH